MCSEPESDEQGFAAFESAVGDLFDGLDDADAAVLQRALGVLRERIGDASAPGLKINAGCEIRLNAGSNDRAGR